VFLKYEYVIWYLNLSSVKVFYTITTDKGTIYCNSVITYQRRSGLCGVSARPHRETVMIRRFLAPSLLCLCLLTAPVLPAFGQNCGNGNGNGNGNGCKKNNTQSVPEPGATLLLALGLGGVVALERWRRKHAVEAP
jgi:hypothetical protein